MAVAVLAAGLTAWVLQDAFLHATAPRGWASLVIVVLVLGAMQMLCLGIIGEYVHGTFLEAKRRPSYIVRDYRPAGGAAARGALTSLQRWRWHAGHRLAGPGIGLGPRLRRAGPRPRRAS